MFFSFIDIRSKVSVFCQRRSASLIFGGLAETLGKRDVLLVL